VLRKALRSSPELKKYAQPISRQTIPLVAFFKKIVAFLKNSRARWKTHSSRGNVVCVIAIKR